MNICSLFFVMMLSLNQDGSVTLTDDSYCGGPLPEGTSIVSVNPLPASAEYCTHSNGVVILRPQAEIDAIDAARTAEATAKAITEATTTVENMSKTLQASTASLTLPSVVFPPNEGVINYDASSNRWMSVPDGLGGYIAVPAPTNEANGLSIKSVDNTIKAKDALDVIQTRKQVYDTVKSNTNPLDDVKLQLLWQKLVAEALAAP